MLESHWLRLKMSNRKSFILKYPLTGPQNYDCLLFFSMLNKSKSFLSVSRVYFLSIQHGFLFPRILL